MTARFKPMTIRQRGGLKIHLNQTAAQHNGKTYDDFIRYMTGKNEFNKPYTKQNIVDAFGITWRTLYSWLDIYKLEAEDAKKAKIEDTI